jgi:hypothetical protein
VELLAIPRPEDQTYLCHPGAQAGVACVFELKSPPRTKVIPYAHLLSIEAIGERLVTLRYSFADVELSLGRDFPGKRQFLDELANFRVSHLREGRQLAIRILCDPLEPRQDVW